MKIRNQLTIEQFRPEDRMDWDLRPDAVKRYDAGIHGAADETADNVISIYDVIGVDFWTGEGITTKRIAGAIRRIGARDLNVHINSPGGDVFEAVGIYNLLLQHPHDVTVKIMGLAASAASVIAMAGSEILIGETGFLMLHEAWAVAIGNKRDMRKAADTLEPIDAALASTYVKQSGAKLSTVEGWMEKETWFNGTQAIEAGLANALLGDGEVLTDDSKKNITDRIKALRRAEALMQKGDATRSEARQLIKILTGGKPSAAPDGKPSAANENPKLVAALEQAIATLKS